jgi:hypothetical protein
MDQFDAVRVNDGKKGGIGQQIISPFPLASQRSLNTGSIQQCDKQILEITLQPSVERTKEPTFERVQESDSDYYS